MKAGIRLEGKKEATLNPWSIRRVKYPSRVRIPLTGITGERALPCVRVGEAVETGQKIADPENAFSVARFASVTGHVTAVDNFPHPLRSFAPAIEITVDLMASTAPGTGRPRDAWQHLADESVLDLFRECGIVSHTDGFPLHAMIAGLEGFPVETLVLNACESEPYVTSDHALLMSHPLEVLKGAEILRKLLGAKKILIALQEDKLEVAELLKSKIYFLKWEHCEVRVLPARYPQELALPLMQSLFGYDLSRNLRFYASDTDTERAKRMQCVLAAWGAALIDPQTLYAAHEALVNQKPFYERAVTVAGECVIQPYNMWLPAGFSFMESFKSCKGLMRDPGKVVMNGPMTGIQQTDLEVPVIAQTRAVLALPAEVTRTARTEPCNHCGDCVSKCPAGISPALITLAAEQDAFTEAEDWGANLCMECGNCTYVCPSKRPMADLIQYAKARLTPPVEKDIALVEEPVIPQRAEQLVFSD